MAEARTQIIVALIGVAGVISAALIANSDKVFPRDPKGDAVVPASSLSPGGEAGPMTAATSVPGIGGWWHDDEGNRFDFSQSGTHYRFVQYSHDVRVGDGEGRLNGRQFAHTFHVDDFGDGTCSGSVSDDGQVTSGRCAAPGKGEWSFSVKAGYGP